MRAWLWAESGKCCEGSDAVYFKVTRLKAVGTITVSILWSRYAPLDTQLEYMSAFLPFG